ncbi:hypothetical protein BJX99DRAFT_240770 [Aspergillus californicus]
MQAVQSLSIWLSPLITYASTDNAPDSIPSEGVIIISHSVTGEDAQSLFPAACWIDPYIRFPGTCPDEINAITTLHVVYSTLPVVYQVEIHQLMRRLTRSWTGRSSSLSSSPPTSTMCRRQNVSAHYLTRASLQEFLEKKFTDHPSLDFHIRLFEDVWSFDAPKEVTQEELEDIAE